MFKQAWRRDVHDIGPMAISMPHPDGQIIITVQDVQLTRTIDFTMSYSDNHCLSFVGIQAWRRDFHLGCDLRTCEYLCTYALAYLRKYLRTYAFAQIFAFVLLNRQIFIFQMEKYSVCPVNTFTWLSVSLMLYHCLRRGPNNNRTARLALH